MEGGLGNRPADALYAVTPYYICTKLAANCLYVSSFWELHPQNPTGAPPVPTLTSEPGYATEIVGLTPGILVYGAA